MVGSPSSVATPLGGAEACAARLRQVTCIIFLFKQFTFNGVLFYFRQKFILACPTTFVGLRILRFTVSLSFALSVDGAAFCLRSYRRHYEVSLSFVWACSRCYVAVCFLTGAKKEN